MSDAAWEALWECGETQREHDDRAAREGRSKAAAEQADKLAAWRASHPDATCSDAIAGMLIEMEERWGR
jgi:hypothetical protein